MRMNRHESIVEMDSVEEDQDMANHENQVDGDERKDGGEITAHLLPDDGRIVQHCSIACPQIVVGEVVLFESICISVQIASNLYTILHRRNFLMVLMDSIPKTITEGKEKIQKMSYDTFAKNVLNDLCRKHAYVYDRRSMAAKEVFKR